MRYGIMDFETCSEADLQKVGSLRYAQHPSTDILCASYCIVEGDVRGAIKTWVPGINPVPNEVSALAQDPEALIVTSNDLFDRSIERCVANPKYSWPLIPLRRRRCAMAVALSFALPAKLERIAAALKFPVQKSPAGRRAMLELCKPRNPRKAEDPTQVYWHERTPEKLALLRARNRDDVAMTAEIIRRFGFLTPAEQAVWEGNEVINERGVYIDRQLLTPMLRLEAEIATWVREEISRLSEGDISSPGQRDRILAWLGQRGCVLPDLRKETVAAALELEDLPDEAHELLDARAKGASAAVHKLRRLDVYLDDRGRVCPSLRYHGAGPGRFTALGAQLQNLRKPRIPDIPTALATAQTGNFELMRERFANPLSILGEISRALIQAAPGKELFIADFSGVESRGAAWICGEDWKVDAWREFDRTHDPRLEPYFKIGHETFGFTDTVARERGKVGDLAFTYGGGRGAWRKFAGKDDTTPDHLVLMFRNAFRAAHPHIRQFWDAAIHLAVKACRSPRTRFQHEGISFYYEPGYLFAFLPSGRRICYPHPKLFVDRRQFHSVETFTFMENTQGRWFRYGAGQRGVFGGFLLENVTQGVCRDLLCEAIHRVEAAGFPVVLHLHDELVVEVDKGTRSLEEFRALMCIAPSWAGGFPIDSKARVSDRFIEIKSQPASSTPEAAE
jgi:DNA polymerase